MLTALLWMNKTQICLSFIFVFDDVVLLLIFNSDGYMDHHLIYGFLTGQVKDFRDLPHRLPPALEPKGDKITSKVDKTRINSADKERINSIEKDRITITIGEEKSKVSLDEIMLC